MVKKSTKAIYILLEPLHHNVNIPIVALCMPYMHVHGDNTQYLIYLTLTHTHIYIYIYIFMAWFAQAPARHFYYINICQ